MTDALALLTTRRSAPPLLMRGPGPNDEQLRQILTIASRVPDHGKLAPWRFIVFAGQGRDRAGQIVAEIFARNNPGADADRLELEKARFRRSPLVVGVVSRAAPHVKIPVYEQELSVGAACMNLTNGAVALGFRTAWLTEWCAFDAEVAARFGLAEHEKFAGFIHIGQVEASVDDRPRPDLAQIVSIF